MPSDKYLALVPTPERLNSVINANLPAVPPTPYHPLRLLSRLCTYREPEGGLKQALESILEFESVYDSFWRTVKKKLLHRKLNGTFMTDDFNYIFYAVSFLISYLSFRLKKNGCFVLPFHAAFSRFFLHLYAGRIILLALLSS